MNKIVSTEKNKKQKESHVMSTLFGGLSIACIVAIVLGNDYFMDKPIIRIIGIAILVILAVIFALLTRSGKTFIKFTQEAKIELFKVVWPTRKESINTTLLVAVLTFIVGLFLWGMDTLFMWVIGLLTGASF